MKSLRFDRLCRDAVNATEGDPVFVASIEQAAHGMFAIDLAHNFAPSQLEALAGQILDAIRLGTVDNLDTCQGCAERMERITAALACLRLGGPQPHGAPVAEGRLH